MTNRQVPLLTTEVKAGETSNPTNFNVRQSRTEVTSVQMTPTGSHVLDVGGQITSFAVLHNDDQGILPRVCKEDNMGRPLCQPDSGKAPGWHP